MMKSGSDDKCGDPIADVLDDFFSDGSLFSGSEDGKQTGGIATGKLKQVTPIPLEEMAAMLRSDGEDEFPSPFNDNKCGEPVALRHEFFTDESLFSKSEDGKTVVPVPLPEKMTMLRSDDDNWSRSSIEKNKPIRCAQLGFSTDESLFSKSEDDMRTPKKVIASQLRLEEIIAMMRSDSEKKSCHGFTTDEDDDDVTVHRSTDGVDIAESIAESLCRIVLECPDDEYRKQAFKLVGVDSFDGFSDGIKVRINRFLSRQTKSILKRTKAKQARY